MRDHITPVAQASADGLPAWTRFHGLLATEVTSDGDIVIDLLDLIEMGTPPPEFEAGHARVVSASMGPT
ncbi:hypothetical protein J3D45_000686 [Microbacterium foliorum]|uniref:hypothetical protein n=1 Tax=Microbacterium foliorum TaxID=104336 RepID=UPI00209C752C|nr:hypothetical protein [Microbacterium foliorum]MCP1428188.1 hypothetical protein [Microbacterium foliorum]